MLDVLCPPFYLNGLFVFVQGPTLITFHFQAKWIPNLVDNASESLGGELKFFFSRDPTLDLLSPNLWDLGVCVFKKIPQVIMFEQFTDLSSRKSHIIDFSSVTQF